MRIFGVFIFVAYYRVEIRYEHITWVQFGLFTNITLSAFYFDFYERILR